MSGRDWCGGPWRAGPRVRGRTCLSGRCLCKFEDGTVLAHFCVNVAQKWRETSSNGPTNSASRVKSASQLNARAAVKVSNECSKDREERVALKRLERRAGGSQAAWEPSENGKLPNKLKQPVFHRLEENLNMIVSFVKKYGRSLLPARWLIYLLEVQARHYKASAKWRNCSLRIMSIYRKQGGQSVWRYTGFLNILPANVSDLPILVIRKQGAGECQYCVHAFCTSAWKRWVPLYTYTTFILCAGPIIWSEMWMISAEIWLKFCFVLSNHLFLRICNSTRREVTRANSFLSATILLNV